MPRWFFVAFVKLWSASDVDSAIHFGALPKQPRLHADRPRQVYGVQRHRKPRRFLQLRWWRKWTRQRQQGDRRCRFRMEELHHGIPVSRSHTVERGPSCARPKRVLHNVRRSNARFSKNWTSAVACCVTVHRKGCRWVFFSVHVLKPLLICNCLFPFLWQQLQSCVIHFRTYER